MSTYSDPSERHVHNSVVLHVGGEPVVRKYNINMIERDDFEKARLNGRAHYLRQATRQQEFIVPATPVERRFFNDPKI